LKGSINTNTFDDFDFGFNSQTEKATNQFNQNKKPHIPKIKLN